MPVPVPVPTVQEFDGHMATDNFVEIDEWCLGIQGSIGELLRNLRDLRNGSTGEAEQFYLTVMDAAHELSGAIFRLRDLCDGPLVPEVGSWSELEGKAARVLGSVGRWGPDQFDVACGMQDNGHQLAVAVALVVRGSWAVMRSEEKGRGTDRRFEGAPLGPGVRVLVVLDEMPSLDERRELEAAVTGTGAILVEVVAAVSAPADSLV